MFLGGAQDPELFPSMLGSLPPARMFVSRKREESNHRRFGRAAIDLFPGIGINKLDMVPMTGKRTTCRIGIFHGRRRI
jgi:hypothetical protein